MLKRTLSAIVAIGISLCAFATPASAAEMPSPLLSAGVGTYMDGKSDEVGRTLHSQDEFRVSEEMTYDEALQYFVNRYGATMTDARAALGTQAEQAHAITRVLSVTLDVTESYHPTLDFYCSISSGVTHWGIQSIYSIQVNPSSNGKTKQFAGTVDAFLRSAYEIEYIINGDFFETGTDSESTAYLGGSVSSSGQHYAYCYQHGTLAFQR